MNKHEKIIDRQVGRNAELFAKAITELETPEERYLGGVARVRV